MLQSKPGSSLFLGIELATDQLRATLVDDNLELMGVECVDFDTEVPEYQSVFAPVLPRDSNIFCRISIHSAGIFVVRSVS